MLCGKGEMGRFSFCKCIGQLYLIQLHNLQDNINITAASASFQTQSLRKEKSNLSISEKGAGWERSAEYEPEHQEEQRFSPLTHRIQNKNLTSLDISKHIAQRWGTNPQCVKLACVFFFLRYTEWKTAARTAVTHNVWHQRTCLFVSARRQFHCTSRHADSFACVFLARSYVYYVLSISFFHCVFSFCLPAFPFCTATIRYSTFSLWYIKESSIVSARISVWCCSFPCSIMSWSTPLM